MLDVGQCLLTKKKAMETRTKFPLRIIPKFFFSIG